MHLTSRQPLIIAGSTDKGEEEMLFAAMGVIKQQYAHVGMILAPRDIARADELVALAATFGLRAGRRTEVANQTNADYDVIILDTIGELGKVYSLGDIIFVGGSLVPTGGHNILEPAAHGKPILVGPHMFNFKETYALFSGRDACATVTDTKQLTDQLLALLSDDQARAAMSQRCLTIIRENQGAARKSAEYLRQLLDQEAN
jgi:3-deoxy-D-manno-octulosonic-acid transferase